MTVFLRRWAWAPGIARSAVLLLAFVFGTGAPAAELDVDRNGITDALTDGILIIRYLLDVGGDTLVAGAVDRSGDNVSASGVKSYLAALTAAGIVDVDANFSSDGPTDGILVARYLFGFRGRSLIDGALGTNAARDTSADVEEYLGVLTPEGQLNDTGIVLCAGEIIGGLPCPGIGYPGQDADYGRDPTRDDDSDGHAGFRFTKLDVNGDPLPANATEWFCVRDDVTGRTWEVKTEDGGLHDKNDRYSWYNPDPASNGGAEGFPDLGGNVCYGYNAADPATLCNTEAFVARVNDAGWCGHRDWRMPTRVELFGLLSLDRHSPAIDTIWFPHTVSSPYWSALTYSNVINNAVPVDFLNGYSGNSSKSFATSVRLVRGAQ